MAEEPSLPSLPSGGDTIYRATRPFKRSRLHSSPPLSSDPPIFSSDDDPSADNYIARNRSKKKFKGPWYSQQPEGPRVGKRSLRRQLDSAVFMGSDATDTDSDAEFSSRARPCTLTSPQRIAMRPLARPSQASPDLLAQREIEACLEEGRQRVELSNCGLEYISNATIKPLATLVVVPRASQGIEAEYERLRPTLEVYLASNMLRYAPGELFRLRGLSVLSLRNNAIEELPSTINYLQKLVECNLSNNKLHYLPYEILDLLSGGARLRDLKLHPNPFIQPYDESSPPSSSHLPSGPKIGLHRPRFVPPIMTCLDALQRPRSWLPGWTVIYQSRSQVRYFDVAGNLVQGPRLPDHSSATHVAPHAPLGSNLMVPIAPLNDSPVPPQSQYLSYRAPSLLELATRAWSSSSEQPSLSDWLNDADAEPEHLSQLLSFAALLREREAGDRVCTVCNRTFVIPRTEWIEWWQIDMVRPEINSSVASPLRNWENRRDNTEKYVPLMRRGCSWRCVPGKLVASTRDHDAERK